MADGLLGELDPDMLKQLRAAIDSMGPSSSDQQTAKMHSIALAGLLGLANSYKPPSMALGIGAAGGMQNYNEELARIGQQRTQTMQSMSQLMPLMMQANMMKSMQGVNVNGRYGDTTAPGNPDAAPMAANAGAASAATSGFDPAVSGLFDAARQGYGAQAQPST